MESSALHRTIAAVLAAGLSNTLVHAQESAELPTITVTADKQTQALERVPASVSAFAGEDAREAGIDSLTGIAQMTPGFTFQAVGQSGLQSPVMRGLTANIMGFSSSVALMVDGVPTLRAQGFDDNLVGIDRIEILRGPQSTLYGRNAEAGVVNIVTRKPGNDPYALVSADLGSRSKRALRVDLSHALVQDTLYMGLAGELFRQDGFIDNTFSGGKEDERKRRNGRVTLRWTPSDHTDATLRYSERAYRDEGSVWGSVSAPRNTVQSGTPSWNHATARTLSLNVEHDITPGLRLHSITARNDYTDRILQDMDFMPADLVHVGRDHHFRTVSQELRLDGRLGDAQWLAGLYLDRDDNDLSFGQKTPAGASTTTARQQGHSTALFTHWTLPLTERWTVTAGARVERNDIRFTLAGDERQSRTWTRMTPKLAVQYAWSPHAQAYANLSGGFRAGGFNAFAPQAYRQYEPEQVMSLELGAKGRLLNQRLGYRAALYAMDVRNMQVQQTGAPGEMFLSNAASARPVGLEAELQYLFGDGWQAQAAVALNRTRFRRFQDGGNDYAHKQAPLAPDLTGYLGLRYDAPKGWYAQARLYGSSKIYLDATNQFGRPGYGVVNLSAGYTMGSTELSFYVENAADKHYDTYGFNNGIVTIYSPPREWGVRLTRRL